MSISVLVYFVLGVLDAMAVMILALKMYRLPVWEYKSQLVVMAVFVSFSSYVMRIMLEVPALDLPLQIVEFVLFFRYVMNIKALWSALIVGASLNAYIILQLLILYAFVLTGAMHYNVVFQSDEAEIQLIQIISIAFTYLIAAIFKVFNYGFSFILCPPHDFSIKDCFEDANRALLLSAVVALVVVSLAMIATLNYMSFLVIPSATIVYGLSYYLSYRKENRL